MEKAVKTWKLKDGRTLELFQEQNSESPREWDNLGIMVCFHKQYMLGDKTDLKSGDFKGWDALEEHLTKEKKAVAILPLYLLDHSGITMKTSSFNDPWDSGQVGFIYTTKEQCKKMGLRFQSKKKLRMELEGEVETYNQYLQGDIYGFVLSKYVTCGSCKHTEKVTEDSCWGFYGQNIGSNGVMEHLPKDVIEGLKTAEVD